MKKLTDEEIDEYLWGSGTVEIGIDDLVMENEIFSLLKKWGGFIATDRGTYRVSREAFNQIQGRGYPVREITKEEE